MKLCRLLFKYLTSNIHLIDRFLNNAKLMKYECYTVNNCIVLKTVLHGGFRYLQGHSQTGEKDI